MQYDRVQLRVVDHRDHFFQLPTAAVSTKRLNFLHFLHFFIVIKVLKSIPCSRGGNFKILDWSHWTPICSNKTNDLHFTSTSLPFKNATNVYRNQQTIYSNNLPLGAELRKLKLAHFWASWWEFNGRRPLDDAIQRAEEDSLERCLCFIKERLLFT